MMNNSSLFYVCSLIEYIGRFQKQRRSVVVNTLGKKTLKRIYNYADVFHCEPIEKIADDFITRCNIPADSYDNVSKCRYEVPDYWTIGDVYERLITDVTDGNDVIDTLIQVYNSWISDAISNYNSDLYYQPRDYIKECFNEGKICA